MPRRCSANRWFGLLLLAPGLSACSAFSADGPPVPDSTMVEVLIEFQLAAARKSVRDDLAPAFRDSIFARHGLDSARFRKGMSYYADHPEAYVSLYTTLLDRLNAERAAHNSSAPRGETYAPP